MCVAEPFSAHTKGNEPVTSVGRSEGKAIPPRVTVSGGSEKGVDLVKNIALKKSAESLKLDPRRYCSRYRLVRGTWDWKKSAL